MGQSILNTVVQLLNDNDVLTEPAQPAAVMPRVHVPVAAVSLEQADWKTKRVTVLVEVVVPAVYGAKQSQDTALDVCQLLTGEGAVCTQNACRYDSTSGLFITPVRAVFSGISLSDDFIPLQPNTVAIDGVLLPYCVSFTAEKKVDAVRPTLADVPWTLSVEEFFPAGTEEPAELGESFEIRAYSQSQREIYSSCTMTQIRRISTPDGIRQLRTATTTEKTIEA